MTEVTKEQLELVANELNTLLGGEIQDLEAGEQIIPTTGTKEETMHLIHEAVDILEPSDTLTDDLCEIVEKTSMGDAVFLSNREDIGKDISIRELFVARTKIALDMGKSEPEPEPLPKKAKKPRKKKPVEEPEPEPEKEELDTIEEHTASEIKLTGPDIIKDADIAKEESIDLSEVEPDKLPEKKKTLADMKIEDLVEVLREEIVPIKRTKNTWERGKSPYSIALELACKHLDTTHDELCALFVKKTGMKLDKTTSPGIRTGRSLVIKVVGLLRAEGHMPKKSTRKAK